MEKLIEILEKLNMTHQESRVYLALLELQESQTGALCNFTRIKSSNIYHILDLLLEKGLINYRVQNNIKIFMPSPPEALNELFLEKQNKLEIERKEIQNLVLNLKKRPKMVESFSKYKYFEKLPGIKSMWLELTENLKEGTVLKAYTCTKGSYEHLLGYYEQMHTNWRKIGIKIELLLSFTEKELGKRRADKYCEVRFAQLENFAEWGIADDYFYFSYITGKVPRAFLIKDKIFAQSFSQVFDVAWKNAKKLPPA